ncbi:thioesterase [Nostoc linckia FACHB-104]|nr:thioesterase [Nostoc linckia FACHB-104]
MKTNISNLNSWIICPQPKPQAQLRLFCFPYAGGSSVIFRSWANYLPSTVEVCAVEIPGRARQIQLPPFSKIEPLVNAIASHIYPYLDKPFAFFGHSMGAWVSFELARLLRKKYGILPVNLFISARRAPHLPESEAAIHSLPEPAFIEELRHLNGTPSAVLDNAELMQLFLPILRADFAVLETYIYSPEAPLECSITAFGGLEDTRVSSDKLQAWQEHTKADFSLHMLPGDHFFIHSAQLLLLEKITKYLANDLSA